MKMYTIRKDHPKIYIKMHLVHNEIKNKDQNSETVN